MSQCFSVLFFIPIIYSPITKVKISHNNHPLFYHIDIFLHLIVHTLITWLIITSSGLQSHHNGPVFCLNAPLSLKINQLSHSNVYFSFRVVHSSIQYPIFHNNSSLSLIMIHTHIPYYIGPLSQNNSPLSLITMIHCLITLIQFPLI